MQDELSQEEINAILKANAGGEGADAPDEEPDAAPAAQDTGLPSGETPPQAVQSSDMRVGGAAVGQEQINTFQTPSGAANRAAAGAAPASLGSIGFLMDIPLDVAVELGRTRIAVKDMLQLGPGSVIELDKLIGEPVDLLVNERLIAKGEVVVFDDNFGVRITDIINPEDRIRTLG